MRFLIAVLLISWAAVTPAQEMPDYPHGEFEDDCELCHQSEGWSPASISSDFDHGKRGMRLSGAHAQTACRACHVTLEFGRLEPVCASCHLDVHQNELGADCGRCHTARSFIDRTMMIRAHLSTRFPLRGMHRAIDCEDCHSSTSPGNLQYVKTPVDCSACHLDSYLSTTDPDHQAEGFPQTCESCHSAQGWLPAGFNHNLLASGVQCESCHLDDYSATTDPDHQAAAFPQDCEICHSTRSWVPTVFDGLSHDAQFFPIFSGQHRSRWTSCNDCHVTPNNFAQFSCIDCHEHDDPTAVGDQHQGVSGFQYESQACFSCHPQGDE